MRRVRGQVMTALAFLFFVEGQRTFFAVLFGLASDAIFPTVDPLGLLVALLPVLGVLAAPLLPTPRWLGRRGAVMAALVGIAVFRVPMSLPDHAARVVSATLVVACAAMLLSWGAGCLGRRTMAVGLVAGVVTDQLLRLAGTSWDISLRPEWMPIQAILSLALLGLVVSWLRDGRGRAVGESNDSLERRTGGLRLRGALALGVLFFLDLHLLGLPVVAARWTGLSYETAAVAVAVAGAAALGTLTVRTAPVPGRAAALGLVLVLPLALALGWLAPGAVGVVAMAAGHLAALLLMARALEPARGRRGPAVASAGMAAFVVAVALYTASYFHGFLTPVLEDAAPWVVTAAVVALMATFVLFPRVGREPGRARWGAGAVVTATVLLAAVVVRAAATGGVASALWAPAPPGGPAQGQAPDSVRVATYNIQYGYDEDWRFDPGAQADVIAEAGPDILALQEVSAGLPIAYGVDLALWLERRLGMHARFAPTTARLQGHAILSRSAIPQVDAWPLPTPAGGNPTQVLAFQVELAGGRLSCFATHFGTDRRDRNAQVTAFLRRVPAGPAVLLGDLNAGPDGEVASAMAAEEFVDAFELVGTSATGTWPARQPVARIDWVRVRDVDVSAARTLRAAASDHRLVMATIRPMSP